MDSPVFPPGPWPAEWRDLEELRMGMIAQLAGVSEDVAVSWVTEGCLLGRGRLGGRNWRADRDDFLLFAKHRGMWPAVHFFEGRVARRIAYFGDDPDSVTQALSASSEPLTVEQFTDTFAFGHAFMGSYPDCIVLDMRWHDMVQIIFILVQSMLPTLERTRIPFIVLKHRPNEAVPPGTRHSVHSLEALLPTAREALGLAG